jgi:hypothetical protein
MARWQCHAVNKKKRKKENPVVVGLWLAAATKTSRDKWLFPLGDVSGGKR